MIRNKTIKFNMDNPVERELWDWLQQLPHGEFSGFTKLYWIQNMRDEKSGKNKLPAEMVEWLKTQPNLKEETK